jgi:hypothetical protein
MTEIRSLECEDLPAVAAMLRANLPGWSEDEHFLAVQTIDHPWADESFPSLVAVDGAKNIIGFIGAQVRRMCLDGASVRGICCTQLAVDSESRNTAVGAFLLKRMVSGEQVLTWSDSSTDPVVRMWGAFGGHTDASRACDWMLVLRPVRWVGGALGALTRRRSAGRELAPVAALPFQAASRRIRPSTHPYPPDDVVSEEAATAALVESLPAITNGIRLWVDHDEAHLDHMFRELERFYETPVVRRLVHRQGRPIGWYAYVDLSGRVAHVLHLAANVREADAVLGELAAHARDTGTSVLAGRAEPHLVGPLSRRFAVLGFARHPVMHEKEPKTAAILATGSSLLTRLDGEPFAT